MTVFFTIQGYAVHWLVGGVWWQNMLFIVVAVARVTLIAQSPHSMLLLAATFLHACFPLDAMCILCVP